ncbi:hypothetical protein N5C93_01985 [Pseudomonas nitroreducens]|uniref:hypothetical protein n=1 Tax=Pseudomonas nitroreducens TaxID=46680 RepID=UPI00244B7E35|nr:hypothetical protein [Pseudomonas nitroreducens]MDH1071594.1 hypothetical protein [Pseudomonas nitroreducens]
MNQQTANIATVAIALCALLLSIWQGYLQRQHDHVSLEPRVNAYFKTDARTDQWGIYVFNNGMGPAYIESLDVLVDGKPMPEGNTGKFGSSLLPLGLDPSCFTVGGPRPNDSLIVGEEIALIEASKSAPAACSPYLNMLLAAARDKIDFTLVIKSIYGDRFEYKFKENIQRPLWL